MGNEDQSCKCSTETCDIFDFMANTVGLTVLHPGGFKATRELAALCGIDASTHVLDNACGKGTTSLFLHSNYGCRVAGVDFDPNLLAQARRLAQKKKAGDRVEFQAGNVERLPFPDNQFDVTIFQAVLILVNNKDRAIREAIRVTKPGGRVGIIELSWQKEPTAQFVSELEETLCATCMLNARTWDGWRNLIFGTGLREVATKRHPFESPGVFKDEGFFKTLNVATKWLVPGIRKRMKTISDLFARNTDFFAYGIYVGEKV